jgi:hypothetical protein
MTTKYEKIVKQMKALLDKFRNNPIEIIGTVLTCISVIAFLLAVKLNVEVLLLCGIILMVLGPAILIISWVINKKLHKKADRLIGIGATWLVFFVFGVGYWLANIMIWISLALILIGIALPIINWIIKKLN